MFALYLEVIQPFCSHSKLLIGALLLSFLLAHECACAEDPFRAPWTTLKSQLETPRRDPSIVGRTAGVWIRFYQLGLHPAMSRGCPCFPSCSEYMQLAISRYGFIPGVILGLDRLMHETEETHYGILIQIDGKIKIYDPIENNIFWLKP